jgi:hypothetical protein
MAFRSYHAGVARNSRVIGTRKRSFLVQGNCPPYTGLTVTAKCTIPKVIEFWHDFVFYTLLLTTLLGGRAEIQMGWADGAVQF